MEAHSISSVWKPDTEGNTSKHLQGSCEVTALKLAASGSAAAVAIYDSATLEGCNYNSLRWFLDASTTDVDAQVFEEGLEFQKGVYAILEQGANSNPIICIAASKYAV